jgi:hypothetical protein
MLRTNLSKAVHNGRPHLSLCISAPVESKRLPQDIVFVIDRSGSTSSDATPGLDESERDGVSILHLVIHCIKAAVECLSDSDRVAVVYFDESAKLHFKMRHMTDGNKTNLLLELDRILSSGGTQIWSGIKMGLDELLSCEIIAGRRNQSILVFTDGLDVAKPLRGNMHELNRMIDANPAWSKTVTMNTVGFGHALDSRDLFELAERLNGTFSHIPEASTAGTILVNRCATDLSTYGNNMRVTITTLDGTISSANLGSIRFGQTRTHAVATPIDEIKTIDVTIFNGSEHVSTRVDFSEMTDDAPTVVACWTKSDLVETLTDIIRAIQTTSLNAALPYSTQQLANFRKRNESNCSMHPYIQGCIDDVDSQLRMAVEKEKRLTTWGLHYIRSYLHATKHEIVNNFRDNSIQSFASPAFTTLQAHCENAFLTRPPIPKRIPALRHTTSATQLTNTVATTRASNGRPSSPPPQPTTSFEERYYSGGCFHPDACVFMSDGRVKPVGQLCKGDVVSCGDSRVASVRCVVWSLGRFQMVNMDGFSLTSTHPVRNPDSERREWVHPAQIASNRSEHNRVVNLLLDSHHEIVGACGHDQSTRLVCCTLAHGFDDAVVEHRYLGTDAVVRDLEQIAGFQTGIVYVTFTRHDADISGVINGPTSLSPA